jgi:hypothetical protein
LIEYDLDKPIFMSSHERKCATKDWLYEATVNGMTTKFSLLNLLMFLTLPEMRIGKAIELLGMDVKFVNPAMDLLESYEALSVHSART